MFFSVFLHVAKSRVYNFSDADTPQDGGLFAGGQDVKIPNSDVSHACCC